MSTADEVFDQEWGVEYRAPSYLPTAKQRKQHARNAALAAPLVLVTLSAIYGQWAWFAENIGQHGDALPIPVGLAALVLALAVETIGLFLAAEAHMRLMAGDPAGPVRAASYAVAAFVGIVNYVHWAPGSVAVVLGVLSALAPWLWAIRSRSLRRDDLRRAGALTPPVVRLGWLRWVLYPRLTWDLFRRAAWDGVSDVSTVLSWTGEDVPADVPPAPAAPVSVPSADDVVRIRARLDAGELLSISKLLAEGCWGKRTRCADLLKAARESGTL